MNPRVWRLGLGLLWVAVMSVGSVAFGQAVPQNPFTRGGPSGTEPGVLPLPEAPVVPSLSAGADPVPRFLPPVTPPTPPAAPTPTPPITHPGAIPGLAPPAVLPLPPLPPLPTTPVSAAPVPPQPPALTIPIPTPPTAPAAPTAPAFVPLPPPPAVVPPVPPAVTAPPVQPAMPSPAPIPKTVMLPTPGGVAVHPPAPPPISLSPTGTTAAAIPPPAAPSPVADTARAVEASWTHGLFVKSRDGNFTAHVGGTLHYDGAWYTGGIGVQRFPGGVGRFGDGANPRRLRLNMDGTFYRDFDYRLELEFMNGFSPAGLAVPAGTNTVSNSPGPTHAWVQARDVPFLGNVRVGSQKEWFSLEHLEQHKTLLYLERSYLFDSSQPSAFNNGFSPGVSAFNAWEWADRRLFTAVGAYKNESNTGGYGVGDGGYALTGRVAGLPVWDPDNQTYWHVGGAMSHRDPVGGQVQVRVRNAVRNAPIPLLNLIADTGAVSADSQTLFNLETAAAIDSLTLSAEYTANLINGARVGNAPSVGTLAYQGFYAQGMYFLTGEHRQWDRNVGVFKRVVPLNNFSPGHGTWGAWEVGARYTYLNLDDKGVNGGRLNNLTLGTTWYWNPNVRLQFNYDYAYRDGGTNPLAKGAIHSLGTRLAMDF